MTPQPHETDRADRRWPQRLYRQGAEPDARFTLANERTFLAWLRTSLALMAAGVGVEALAVVTGGSNALRTTLALALLAAGIVCSVGAFARWFATELALRTGRPLPAPRLAPVLGVGLAVVGAAMCVLLLTYGV